MHEKPSHAPEGEGVEGQTYPISKEKNLQGTLETAAKDAAFNNVTYRVDVRIPGKEEIIEVDQDRAREILGDKEYERIKASS